MASSDRAVLTSERGERRPWWGWALLARLVVLLWGLGGWSVKPAWSDEPGVPSEVWGERTETEVDLVYTGGLGGIGMGSYAFGSAERLETALGEHGVKVGDVHILHGVLVQHGSMLWADDGSVGTVLAFAEAGYPTCGDDEPVTLVSTSDERIAFYGAREFEGVADDLGFETQDATLRLCFAGGRRVWWVAPEGEPIPQWDLDAWDVRLGYLLRVQTASGPAVIPVVGVPRQDASRRFRLLEGLLKSSRGAIYVDAGDFLDGFGLSDPAALSDHRATDLEMLSRLGPTALVPGFGELAGGAQRLLSEARSRGLPYVASNWVAKDDALALPWVMQRTMDVNGVAHHIAFLGVIDPDIALSLPGLADEGITIADPVTSVQERVERLLEQDDPPDAIVVLGLLSPDRLTQLRRSVHGVQLLIGDRAASGWRVQVSEAQLRPVPAYARTGPLTLPIGGVYVARLQFEDRALRRVRTTHVPISANLPSDPVISARVTRVRAASYAGLDDVLVDSDPEHPLANLPPEKFAHLACEALREASGAEIGVLAALPAGIQIPGPLTALLAADRLRGVDRVEVHQVPGSLLKDLLLRMEASVPTLCGASGGVVEGRGILADRVYRLVTTDRTRRTTPLGTLLGIRSESDLAKARVAFMADTVNPAGLTLQNVVLSVLRARRAKDGQAGMVQMLARSASSTRPAWLLNIGRIGFDLSRFNGTGKSELSALPDAQAGNASSLTIGANLDATLSYLSQKVTWEVRTKLQYRTIRVDGQPLQESADDIQLSTAVELPLLAFPQKVFRFQPYAEVLWDSEFRPQRDAHGGVMPRQSDLYFTVGLSASKAWLKQWRMGAFVNEDLSRATAGKPPVFGGKLNLETSVVLPPQSALRFETTWDLRAWSGTPYDGASDMRVRLMAEGRLVATPLRWLQAGVFIQGYIVKGRVPGLNDVLGLSWTAGAMLSASSAIDLTRPWRGQPAKAWRSVLKQE